MWGSYHCCDIITQMWSFIYSVNNAPNDIEWTEKLLDSLGEFIRKYLKNGEDLQIAKYEDIIFDWKQNFKYHNKGWEENMVYYCNELLQGIFVKTHNYNEYSHCEKI